MQFHEIKRKNKNKRKKLIGRGGKKGTYSGKGLKGQKSRAGRKLRPEMRDIIKKIPKRRGYRFASIETKPTIINLEIIDKKFKNGDTVSIETLVSSGLIRKTGKRNPVVKILGGGKIGKGLTFSGLIISGEAKKKIEKAGGKIE